MVLVPENMTCFGFSPCNLFIFVFGPCKILFLKIVPENILKGTIFKNKILCRDLFKNQNILQELFFYKMGQSSCDTCANHHKSGVRDQNQNKAYLQGPKTTTKKIQGL